MLLTQGTLASVRCKFIGGTSTGHGLQAGSRLAYAPWNDLARFQGGLDQHTSVPDGYRGGVAISLARVDGGMSGAIISSGTLASVNLEALGVLTLLASGIGVTTGVNLAGGIGVSSLVSGSADMSSADARGKARISCTISIGAKPTAFDIAQAVITSSLAGVEAADNVANALKRTLKRDEYLGLG